MTTEECREVFKLLSEYIDGDLPPDLCSHLQEHIEECPPCIEFLQSLEKTRDLCKKLQQEERPKPLPEASKQELLAAFRRVKR